MPQYLRIAYDLDDVLVPFIGPLAAFYNSENGTDHQLEDFHSYNFTEVWGGDATRTINIVTRFFQSEYAHIRPTQDVLDALKLCRSLGHQQTCVTSRHLRSTYEFTKEQVKRYFGQYLSGLTFSHNSFYDDDELPGKWDICYQEGADLIVDDYLTTVADAVKACRHGAILFGDYPWNQTEILPPRVKRVSSWQKYMEFIQSLHTSR